MSSLSKFVPKNERDAVRWTYQLLGLSERVLHVGEAEAGQSDELTHHRHKLVAKLLRPLPLVIQLLGVQMTRENEMGAEA